jgi:hypothetical protein
MPNLEGPLAGVDEDSNRFNRQVAVAFPDVTPPGMESPADPGDILMREVGDWLLADDPELGHPHASRGGAGRGASGWVPVVEWAARAVAGGVVSRMAMLAFAKVYRRILQSGQGGRAVYLSRGAAALVAADHVTRRYYDSGPLEVEAIEEPSSIAGWGETETSYHGLEPWVVLFVNRERGCRYVVLMRPNGEIMGDIAADFLEYEGVYLRPSRFWGEPTR